MSGTSLDGIDVAIVDIAGRRWKTVAHGTRPYKTQVREEILAVSNTETNTARIARLHVLLAELYADAIQRTCRSAGIEIDSVQLIGCHGQTVYHQGAAAPYLGKRVATTLQIGDGSVLAERTGKPVVSDFRLRDMAAGGRGAPLVPYVDYLLFRHAKRCRAALNIGGIANVTVIPPGGSESDVVAFDTGPGNMVLDSLVRRHTRGRETHDRDGAIAAGGKVDRALLRRLMRNSYYRQRPPKTAGREEYGAEFLAGLPKLPFADLVATMTAFTAAAVANGIDRFAPAPVDDLVVSGGGVHNRAMMAYLAAFLPRVRVTTSAEFGIDVDAKEAIAFAVMAHETWHRRPSNLPSATGARRAVVLGKISP